MTRWGAAGNQHLSSNSLKDSPLSRPLPPPRLSGEAGRFLPGRLTALANRQEVAASSLLGPGATGCQGRRPLNTVGRGITEPAGIGGEGADTRHL